ncbi:MAG: hypothetical protein ACRCWD_04030 [Culicoidibacterales bacterium]
MKKWLSILVLAVTVMIFTACDGQVYSANVLRQGFYQSEVLSSGYRLQLTIDDEQKQFTEYIDNRLVNTGKYQELATGEYELQGNEHVQFVTVSKSEATVIIPKLNGSEPIRLLYIDSPMIDFTTEFNDLDAYKALLLAE